MDTALEGLAGWLDRCYSKALILYPAEFRHQFGAEMVQFFREDCRRTLRREGTTGLLLLAIRSLGDLAFSAPGVHMEILRQDLRFACRMLAAAKAFSFTAIAALALGIGANSAIFSLVNTILLRPLRFPESDRLVAIWEKNPRGIDRNSVAPPNFADFRAGARTLAQVAAFYDESANLLVDGEAEHVTSAVVSPEFFSVLQVAPLVGGGLGSEPGSVVLSHRLWVRRFGGDAAVVGRNVRINDREYTIRGVMPGDFRFPASDTAIWTSMPFDPAGFSRQAHFLSVVGRIKPGATLAHSRAELNVLAAGLAASYPASNRGWGVTVLGLQEQLVGEVRTSLLVFAGAVGLVLLIACANIANLLLARSTNREGETAVRTALGASTIRLARQWITESVLLSVLGGVAGLALAMACVAALKALRPAALPRLEEVSVNGWVIAFTFALSLLTGVVCGLFPAWRIGRVDVNAGLKEGGRHQRSFAGHRLRGLLIVTEVALSLLLVVGAGLLIRTFLHLRQLDPGFRAEQVASLTFDMPSLRYGDAQRRSGLMEEIAARVRTVPGIEAAGMISNLPLTGGEGFNRFGFTIEGKPVPETTGNYRFYGRWITPGYLAAMSIPLVQGRDFSKADRAGSAAVVIIDATLARRYFPGENPVGKFVRLSYARSEPREIVGVAREVRLLGLDTEPAPQIYIPAAQESRSPTMTLVVRSSGPAGFAAERASTVLREIDRNLPVYDVQPLARLVADSIATRRFHTWIMGLLAALALFLAAVGVYGVMSCMVGERWREIGIRMALGARGPHILWLIVGQGMKQAAAGAVLGLGAALLLTKALSGLLYGVDPLDRWSFVGAAFTVLAAALLACLVPAAKAARLDPMRALRR